MKLYILRHGDAVEFGDSRYKEAERPLTPRGIQRTKLLTHALRQMEISFDAVLSSPLLRAKETAEIVVRGMHLPATLKLTDSLAPSGSMESLVHEITAIRPIPDNALLVGHEPYLSGFISLLCTGGTELSLTMKKGGLCRLEVESPSCSRCAVLEWLMPPRLLGFNPPKRKS
jgi:phosphohistidine phosphatase